jgi:predicted secreted protein
MATAGVMNGTKLRLYIDVAAGSTYVVMGTSLDCTINFSHATRETTNQDSAGWAYFLEGKRSATIDFNNLYAENSAVNFEDFLAVLLDSTLRGKVTFKLATATTGDSTITGTGYLTSLVKASGGPEANVTMNGSLQVTGVVTTGTVA